MNLVGVMKTLYLMLWRYLAVSSGSVGKQSTCNAGNTGEVGLIPGMGRYSEGENGNALQYSGPGNLMDRRTW